MSSLNDAPHSVRKPGPRKKARREFTVRVRVGDNAPFAQVLSQALASAQALQGDKLEAGVYTLRGVVDVEEGGL